MNDLVVARLSSTRLGYLEKLTYWQGRLAFDCGEAVTTTNPARLRARAARKAAWDAYEAGRVTLLQRRLEACGFEYLCIGTGR